MQGKFTEIPLDELRTPKEGYVCMLNRFWLLGPGGGALSYDVPRRRHMGPQVDRFPQCNSTENVVQHMATRAQGGAVKYMQIPVAYWPPSRDD